MGSKYNQLSETERHSIANLQTTGHSVRQIAATLGRTPSTISREIKRNSTGEGYKPAWAGGLTQARRWTGGKLERDEQLFNKVFEGLAKRWSPEQISGKLRRDGGPLQVSYETIYRFIYAQFKRTTDYSWQSFLPRKKWKRGLKRKRVGSPASLMKDVVSVHARAIEALNRMAPGHWEGDLMLFSRYGQAVLVLHERRSRMTFAVKLENRTAGMVADKIEDLLGSLPPELRRTIAFDNGTEFAQHYRLPLVTYFCDTHSPWQKGGIENAIGRLRRALPRKTDLQDFTDLDMLGLLRNYNNTPRKCLDFQTPAEVFCPQVLHFKCESTSPLT
jgi:IS30 family transposase